MLGLFLGTVSWPYVAFGSMAIAHGLRLGALDSCDASRLSMHVPMCRPQSCSTSFPPRETWMNILVVVMNDAHPSF